ncbi:P-loop containing nucleoside triphosphate hydrolase protein [Schizophyllum commune H4-8]|uniref:P-loop containing nucleoside triphosphate hydrolase protein n=1 Tax=Schizophyllum commune (strain H4-8 / FGSC 9210) TaxID=578458 RepID=UPI00215E69A2|nr:P-loop containing nucleoside triphosphate hydrolase protein [Schizophyllum commune H4-8]KAI5888666.1 P-loop containing nucleoside triphosphate hydrolase protein [Schizophyllum commune H4-8]
MPSGGNGGPARYPGSCRDFPEGLCTAGDLCRFRHDLCKCSCGLILPFGNLRQHQRGRRHQALLEKHQEAEQRRAYTADAGRPPPRRAEPPPARAAKITCETCGAEVHPAQIQRHRHQHIQDDIAATQALLYEDKNGIAVTPGDGIHFGVVDEFEEPSRSPRVNLTLAKTAGEESRILLMKWWMESSKRKDALGEHFSVSLLGNGPWIKTGRPRAVTVTLHPSYVGNFDDTVYLRFLDVAQRTRPFVIARKVSAVIGSRQDHEQLRPAAPYARRQMPAGFFEGAIVKGTRPEVWSKTVWKRPLGQYEPPKALIEAVYGTERGRRAQSERATLSLLQNQFLPRFGWEKYGEYFQVLLHVEEEQQRQDLESYAMESVELKANYPNYELQVQGLSEGRPSVLVGDFIEIRRSGERNAPWFQGRVHAVMLEAVKLRFPEEFSTYRGSKFDVRFVLNRLSYRRMHDALVNKNKPMRILFPTEKHLQVRGPVAQARVDAIVPVNRAIADDEEQLRTIAAVLRLPPGSPPLIVFGPPGTGKTSTIVEAIHQLLQRDPNTRILACAPSNTAADGLAQKLSGALLDRTQLFRLNSLSRKVSDLPQALKKFCLINDNTVFAVPPKDVLASYRVVVSTCITAGVPSGLGIRAGHFDWIFIDECAQATEPAAMIPLKTLVDKSTNVVLAGDPQQLGPIVHSKFANTLGLKESYMGRLMEQQEVYDLKKWQGVTIMKLIKSFRSHPALLDYSNRRFYNGELIASADPILTHSLEGSEILPKKSFPILFHAVIGKDARERSSPSFFNIEEASLVKKYCASLLSDRKHQLRPQDIGVITPYHAQTQKIASLVDRDDRLRGITVGSIEQFQGQERRVIIISTVRSSEDFLVSDIRRMLGFVANPRRFNVAITRAQAMLIVVGNPRILSLDINWRGFMNYVHNKGGWRGVPITWDPKEDLDPGPEGYDGKMNQLAAEQAKVLLQQLRSTIAQDEEGGVEVDLSDDDSDESVDDAPAVFREVE